MKNPKSVANKVHAMKKKFGLPLGTSKAYSTRGNPKTTKKVIDKSTPAKGAKRSRKPKEYKSEEVIEDNDLEGEEVVEEADEMVEDQEADFANEDDGVEA